MLTLRRLVIENFGPFKNQQEIEFPQEGGVSIVWGENMRGKTTLLNALRYALFGKVITRGEQPLALHLIGNWEKADEGLYGFKVILEFDNSGQSYELIRECKLRDGVKTPQSDMDYIQQHYLRRDGTVLSPNDTQAEIIRLMPEKISRFFLFDGELLQQYEELLRHETIMGEQIKVAIERILGLPVLTNARTHLNLLYQDAQRKESHAAQNDKKTQELGNHISVEIAKRDFHEKEIQRLSEELERLRADKLAKEDKMKRYQKLRSLLIEREQLQTDIKDISTKIFEREDKRREIMSDAWRWMLLSRIRSIRHTLEDELNNLKTKQASKTVNRELIDKLSEALDANQCTICMQFLSESAKVSIENKLIELRKESHDEDLSDKIQKLTLRVVGLQQNETESSSDLLKEINDTIDEMIVTRASKEDRVREIGQATKDVDEAEIRKLASDYDNVVREITLIEDGTKKEEAAREECDQNIKKLQDKIKKIVGSDVTRESKRRELCGKLQELFNDGVAAYRDRLREKVEADATSLFLKLTSEPDYKGLKINDNYGLTIIHKDGKAIPVRSAGAEHIVALSLMGSLQRNAPISGPIIMDSPFGRLDREHTTKVVEALPTMANQVMLCVYESELEPYMAREHLLGNLKKEYRILRKSARYSSIEKYLEA